MLDKLLMWVDKILGEGPIFIAQIRLGRRRHLEIQFVVIVYQDSGSEPKCGPLIGEQFININTFL